MRTLSYQYDADGARTRITHPDGRSFVYAYDGLDRNVLISDGADMAVLTQSQSTMPTARPTPCRGRWQLPTIVRTIWAG